MQNKIVKNLIVLFAVLAAGNAWASLLYLNNGDRLTGEIVGKNAEAYAFKTSMGVLTIPTANVVRIVEGDLDPAAQIPQAAAIAADANAVGAGNSGAAVSGSTAAEEVKPDPYADLPWWMREYKYFLQENIPEGWKFKIKGGIEYRKTSSELMSYSLSFSGAKDWSDINHFDFNLYYDYTQETVSNVTSNTTDKYGLDTTFRHDLTDAMSDPFDTGGEYKLYLENLLNYKRDEVKSINHEVDEGMTFGASFDFPDSGFKFHVGPGPVVRYLCADNYDYHWVLMGVVSQGLSWDFNRLMRLEQKLYFGQNATHFSQHSLDFMLGLVAHATDVMDIALRYTYEYDTINSSTAITTEQRLVLAFEFPLY